MKPTSFYDFTIPANGTYRLLVAGDYFKIMNATGAVNVQADFGNLRGLIAGQGLEDSPFKFLVFDDASGASNAVRVVIGDEKFVDGLGGTVNVSQAVVARSNSFANVAKTVTNASAQLLAANPARQYLLIQNRDTAGSLYVNFGAGAATVANGVLISPGGSYETGSVCTTQAVQCIGSIASNANVLTVEG
jgi:hypothetical protein